MIPKPMKRPKKPWRAIKRSAPIKRGRRPREVKADRFGSYRAQVKYANELWRRLIYAKEPGGLCARCLQRPWVEACHCFIKGAYPALRFELDNGAPCCRSCHRIIDSNHLAKEEFFIRYIGAVAYQRLELRAQSRAKSDLKLTILYLEAKSMRW